MTIRKSYEGTCNACGNESKYLERDHRVPPRLGGERSHQSNLQDLCLECHKRKSVLEVSLMNFYGPTDVVREWLLLAFQDDVDSMIAFAGKIAMRATHIREVVSTLDRRPLRENGPQVETLGTFLKNVLPESDQ